VFLASLEIVLRNEVVPGANDNLSGVAALPILARRLAKDQPDDVEFVFVSTAAEEAMMGGANILAREVEAAWDKTRTVVVVLDTLSLGSLRFLDPEGQITPLTVPSWLRETVLAVAAGDSRFHEVQAFRPPVGGTDAAPFLARGWDAVALTCIDPELGSARHYHQLSDDPDNLDIDQVLHAIDFAEALARRIVIDRREVWPGA
jgi:Zn-dependent M28 family amino/carboxypeptidase